MDNKVIGGNFFENAEVKAGQVQYYLEEANSIAPEGVEDTEETAQETEEAQKEPENVVEADTNEASEVNNIDMYGISTLSLEPEKVTEEETTTTSKRKNKKNK